MQAHLIRLRPGVENKHKRSFSGVVGLTEESGKTQCCVDVVSSGVLTPIKTRQPVARVRVFGGYKLGNPDLYPGATRDIYLRVSHTRGIPYSCLLDPMWWIQLQVEAHLIE